MTKIIVRSKDLLTPIGGRKDRNPALVYIAGLTSRHSQRTMKWALQFATNMIGAISFDQVPWHKFRYQHVARIRAEMLKDEMLSPSAANTVLSALRGVAKQAFLLDLMDAEDYQKVRMVKSVKSEILPAGRELTQGEINALIEVCSEDQTTSGVRDAAIICILAGVGARRREVVNLNLDHYNPEDGRLVFRRTKSRRDRETFLINGAADAMNDWLHIRGDDPGPLFHPINKSETINPKRMSSQSIYAILKRRGAEVGIENLSPHDLRRTVITTLLRRGIDLLVVQRIAGHANPATTARYDRRGDEAMIEGLSCISLPYKRRFSEDGK